jgi:hypothetical protein
MARVPHLTAQRTPKATTLSVDLLPAEDVLAVKAVLKYLNRHHGLLLGHVGRQLSIGPNKDLMSYLNRNHLTRQVRDEILALCGISELVVFLALPEAPLAERERVEATLCSHGLIGKIRLRVPRQQYDRDTYLDS